MASAQLIIFDCDGVLVDSERISNEVLARALSDRGLPTTLQQARREYQGLLLCEVVARAEAKLGQRLPDGWLERYEHDRTEEFRRGLVAVPGVAEAVRAISAEGVAVCVASQGKLAKTRLSLELTGLRGLFADDQLFSAHSVAQGKPAPALFLHAAAYMNVQPSRCTVIEDTPSGVLAAVAAGMRAFGYSADSDESALCDAGAQTFISMSELPRLVGLG
jgi:HAD superfamily hydrolase (TIGR01509 family)